MKSWTVQVEVRLSVPGWEVGRERAMHGRLSVSDSESALKT